MLHNDQQDGMLNMGYSACRLKVSRHKGVVVIGVKMQCRPAKRDVYTLSCHCQVTGIVSTSKANVH